MWIEHIPGGVNPGDCFSRRLEQEKVHEVATLLQLTQGRLVDPVWPQVLGFRPSQWQTLVREAQLFRKHGRSPSVTLAASLTAVVASKGIVDVLNAWFKPDAQALALGWWPKEYSLLTDATFWFPNVLKTLLGAVWARRRALEVTSIMVERAEWSTVVTDLSGPCVVLVLLQSGAHWRARHADGWFNEFEPDPLGCSVSPVCISFGRAPREPPKRVRKQLARTFSWSPWQMLPRLVLKIAI